MPKHRTRNLGSNANHGQPVRDAQEVTEMHTKQHATHTRSRAPRRPGPVLDRSASEWMGHTVVAGTATWSAAPTRRTTRRTWRALAESVGW